MWAARRDMLRGQAWAGGVLWGRIRKGSSGGHTAAPALLPVPLPAGDAWPHLIEAEVPLGHHFLKRVAGRGRPLSPSLQRGEEQGEEQEGAWGGHGAAEPRAGKRRGRAQPGGHGVTAHGVRGTEPGAGLGLRGPPLRAAGAGWWRWGLSGPRGAAGSSDSTTPAGRELTAWETRTHEAAGGARTTGARSDRTGRGDRERWRCSLCPEQRASPQAEGQNHREGGLERPVEPERKCRAGRPEVWGREAGSGRAPSPGRARAERRSLAVRRQDDTMAAGGPLLPDSVLFEIFLYLDHADVLAVGLVCRQWRAVARDEFLWKELFYRYYRVSRDVPRHPGAPLGAPRAGGRGRAVMCPKGARESPRALRRAVRRPGRFGSPCWPCGESRRAVVIAAGFS